jgi:putative transposase
VAAIREKVNISERRACRLVGLSLSVLHYEAKPDHENEALTVRLVELVHERPRFGYRRLHALVEREGIHANHKRVHRLYREAGLAVRRRRRRHGVMIEGEQLALPSRPNEVWSIDFVMDALSNGRRLKCLTVVDDFTKEAADIVVDHGISGLYVARALDRAARFRGYPKPGSGIHEPGTRPMGVCERRHAKVDSARKADAECVHRIVQRQVPR